MRSVVLAMLVDERLLHRDSSGAVTKMRRPGVHRVDALLFVVACHGVMLLRCIALIGDGKHDPNAPLQRIDNNLIIDDKLCLHGFGWKCALC